MRVERGQAAEVRVGRRRMRGSMVGWGYGWMIVFVIVVIVVCSGSGEKF